MKKVKKYKTKPKLILNCQCAEGRLRHCDRLKIFDFCKEWVEINVEFLKKGKRKLAGGVIVNKKDLIKYCK